jgi:hypothetical protein
MEKSILLPVAKQDNIIELSIIQRIHEIRGVRVILDFDLAEIYEVTTSNLNKAVQRNLERFPEDFMFQLTVDEFHLIFQNGTSSWGGTRKLPFAFTEQGVAMLSGVLRSQKAIRENIKIMRAFVAIRQYVLNYAELKHELDNFMRETNAKFDKNDMKFDALFALFDEFIAHKKELEKPSNPIGFRTSANS